jgi:hypothetical protein
MRHQVDALAFLTHDTEADGHGCEDSIKSASPRIEPQGMKVTVEIRPLHSEPMGYERSRDLGKNNQLAWDTSVKL